MATVIVNSPTEVLVDGDRFGAVADTIVNNPQLASAIQLALAAKWSERESDFSAQLSAEATAKSLAESDLALLKEAVLSEDPARIKDAITPHKEKELLALDQQIAELEAKKLLLQESADKGKA